MCCGKRRMQQRAKVPKPLRSDVRSGGRQQQEAVSFVNVGETELIVQGPISGIEYRFDGPGARVQVDPRDRVLLAAIRQVRQVK